MEQGAGTQRAAEHVSGSASGSRPLLSRVPAVERSNHPTHQNSPRAVERALHAVPVHDAAHVGAHRGEGVLLTLLVTEHGHLQLKQGMARQRGSWRVMEGSEGSTGNVRGRAGSTRLIEEDRQPGSPGRHVQRRSRTRCTHLVQAALHDGASARLHLVRQRDLRERGVRSRTKQLAVCSASRTGGWGESGAVCSVS